MAAATTAIAAGVAVAATAASTAYSMSNQPDDPSLAQAGYVGPGLQERLFNRGTRDILDSERAILDDALAQGKLVEPAMYAALGLEPVYDRPEDPEVGNLSAALAGKQQRLAAIRTERAGLRNRPGGAARDKQVKKLNRESVRLKRDIATATTDLEQRGAIGRKVVGFKPLAGPADPTGSAGNSFGGALDAFNAHLASALAGKEPLDPTLRSSFDEKERTLRERLRRQMGPDYETSTAGAQALANFDRERSEAFASYNTQAIGYYSGLSESRAGALSELTTGRLKNLAFPSTFRATLGSMLEGAADARGRYASSLSGERAEKGDALARQYEAQAQSQRERTAAIAGLIQQTGSAASSAIGGMGGMGGGGSGGGGGMSMMSSLSGSSVSEAAGGVGPPSQGLAGVGGSFGGGKLQNLLGM